MKRERLGGEIILPATLTSILGLEQQSFVYVTATSINNSNDVTILLSNFDPNHWGDIWRLEFDVHDRIGILSELFGILADYRIQLLSCEASPSDVEGYHTISAFFNFHYYLDSLSQSSRDRIDKRAVASSDFEAEIIVSFLDDMFFRDDNLPRLRVRRVEEYRRLFKQILEQSLPLPSRVRLINGNLSLAGLQCLDQNFYTNIKMRDFFILPVVDTKDRIMRIHLHGEDRDLYERIFVIRNDASAMQEIFSIIQDNGWTCDLIRIDRGSFGTSINDADAASDKYLSMRIVIRSPGRRSQQIVNLEQELYGSPKLLAAGLKISKPI